MKFVRVLNKTLVLIQVPAGSVNVILNYNTVVPLLKMQI